MIRYPIQAGYPIVLSRNTDVARWYMDWLKQCLRVGYVIAPDPKSALPVKWSVDPSHVPAFVFFTKHPSDLAEAADNWLIPYRLTASVTITGWDEVEHRTPSMEEQLRGLSRLVSVLGPERVKWRYSPIPPNVVSDQRLFGRLRHIAEHVSDLGLSEVEVSTMLPSPHWDGPTETEEQRREAVLKVAGVLSEYDLSVGVCSNDNVFLDSPHVCRATCVDRSRLNQIFGLSLPEDSISCRCKRSIDPCSGVEFACGSGCEYCYVPETTTGGGCE